MSDTEFPPIDPEQPAFIRVPVKCLPTIISALMEDNYVQEAKTVQEFSRDYTDPEANAERLLWLERAEKWREWGEVEFDSDATISHSTDNGQYVLGWIWVDGPEEEEEDEDDEPTCDCGALGESTFCGTMCKTCFKKHCKECGVCNEDGGPFYDGPVWPTDEDEE